MMNLASLSDRFVKIRKRHPFVVGCVGLPLAFFCLANAFHWLVVLYHHYPLFCYFPEHSFTVVDADTHQPVEGVIAVYRYHGASIGPSGPHSMPLPDLAGRGIYAAYLQIANPLRHENLKWYAGDYVAFMTEAVSDARGKIVIPAVGPLMRRRNFYFDAVGAPASFILKNGYRIQRLSKDEHSGSAGWRRIPEWSGTTVSIQRKESTNLTDEANAAYWIYQQCFEIFDRQEARRLIPNTYQFFVSRKSEFVDESGQIIRVEEKSITRDCP